MKRRTFITSIFGAALTSAAVTTPIVYGVTHKKEVAKVSAKFVAKRKARALFQRFFRNATTFEPTPTQMFWFDQYEQDVRLFTGPRQTGNTTLMLVLALFENKARGTNIALFPSNAHMLIRCRQLLGVMEERLGKSTLDGKVYSHDNRGELQLGKPLKVFVMNDANIMPAEFSGDLPMVAENARFFGTHETRPYVVTNFRPAIV